MGAPPQEVTPAAERRRSVVDGVIQQLSVSQITSADPSQKGGCLRRWHWNKVARKPEPQRKAAAIGEAIHKEIEHYLKTGVDALSRHVRAALPFIPTPGKDLAIEAQLTGVLDSEGIPLVGKIDLIHTRGRYCTPAGAEACDAEGTAEVIDWKSTSNLDAYHLRPDELMGTVQMPGYAEYAFRALTTLDHARLSHVGISTRTPDACKSTVLVDRDQVASRWAAIGAVTRTMIHAAAVPDSNLVDANPRACDAWGGCAHRSYCNLNRDQTITAIFGPRAAESLVRKLKGVPEMDTPFNLPGLPVDPAIAALQAQVATPATPTVASLPPGFADAVATIRGANLGNPRYEGQAAAMYSVIMIGEGKRNHVDETPWSGAGPLAQAAVVTDAAGMIALANALVAGKHAQPMQYQAPQAPMPAAVNPLANALSMIPPEAPVSKPEIAAYSPGEKSANKGGRKPKTAEAPVAPAATAPTAPTAPTGAGLTILVDCVTTATAQSLLGYVDQLHSAIAQQCNVTDVRCAPKTDERLAFGNWKGVIASLAREQPPGPGVYTLDTRGNEIAEVVAEALRPLATLFVRGIR